MIDADASMEKSLEKSSDGHERFRVEGEVSCKDDDDVVWVWQRTKMTCYSHHWLYLYQEARRVSAPDFGKRSAPEERFMVGKVNHGVFFTNSGGGRQDGGDNHNIICIQFSQLKNDDDDDDVILIKGRGQQ